MEMLCDTCIHGYDGAPNIMRPECYGSIIKRDESDYVVSCSNYKQKPMLTNKVPDDTMTNGQTQDKPQKNKSGLCCFCKCSGTSSCIISNKKINVRGEVYECTQFYPTKNALMIPSGEPPKENQSKPEMPVIPSAYASANKRIKELSNGISYIASYYGDAYKDIRVYAKEILAQCDLIERCTKEEQL